MRDEGSGIAEEIHNSHDSLKKALLFIFHLSYNKSITWLKKVILTKLLLTYISTLDKLNGQMIDQRGMRVDFSYVCLYRANINLINYNHFPQEIEEIFLLDVNT